MPQNMNPTTPGVSYVFGQAQQSIPQSANAVMAICGKFSRGPQNVATFCGSPTEFAQIFGGPFAGSVAPDAVAAYMNLSGAGAWVVRAKAASGTAAASIPVTASLADVTSEAITLSASPQAVTTVGDPITEGFAVGDSITIDTSTSSEVVVLTAVASGSVSGIFTKNHNSGVAITATPTVFTLTANNAGAWGNGVSATIAVNGTADTSYAWVMSVFDSSISASIPVETWNFQVTNSAVANYLSNVLQNSNYVTASSILSFPVLTAATYTLSGGSDGASLTAASYVGVSANGTGIYAFNAVQDSCNLIAPDSQTNTVYAAAVAYCAGRGDFFFIHSTLPATLTTTEALADYAAYTSPSVFAAFYGPQIYIADPINVGQNKLIPPDGNIAAAFAVTDATRGFWKAPAGVAAGIGAVQGLAVNWSDTDQSILNPSNINVIRNFTDSGIVIWGARTESFVTDATRYVPAQRTLMTIAKDLVKGSKWVTFEGNDSNLWSQIISSFNAYLENRKKQGAVTDYFVKCDAELNTPYVIGQGKTLAQVGVAPVIPTEFFIITISQMQSGGSATIA